MSEEVIAQVFLWNGEVLPNSLANVWLRPHRYFLHHFNWSYVFKQHLFSLVGFDALKQQTAILIKLINAVLVVVIVSLLTEVAIERLLATSKNVVTVISAIVLFRGISESEYSIVRRYSVLTVFALIFLNLRHVEVVIKADFSLNHLSLWNYWLRSILYLESNYWALPINRVHL